MERLRLIVGRQFPTLWPPVEAVLATVLAMVPDDVVNPPTCMLVGSSSSAKTTVLDMVGEIDGVTYRSDRFTPKSFVSHAANVKREQLETIDLLPRLKHRALVTPELAPMFRGDDKTLTETFAILTAVLDGHGYIGDSGTQGRRGYSGDYLFAWLGATTPLPTHVWKVMAQLGSRLFFLSMPEAAIGRKELVRSLTGDISYRDRLVICHEVVKQFLVQRLDEHGGVRGVKWNRGADPEDVVDIIAAYAELVARARGVVSVWQERGAEDFSYTPANIEGPHRALAALYNLARGRALLCGRRQLSPDDLGLVRAVALSSMPTERSRLFQALVHQGGIVTTTQATAALAVTAPTARRVMKAFALLDIADMDESETEGYRLTLKPEWKWCLQTGEHTPPAGFQGGESDPGVCVSPSEEVVDPWKES